METAAARSFKPSILLYLASAKTPINQGKGSLSAKFRLKDLSTLLTGIGVTAERSGPLDKGGALLGTGGNGEQTDGAQRRGVREGRVGGDDGEGDVVLERAVLLLLDLLDGSVL